MLQFKNDKALLAFAAVLVVATAALIWHGDVTWKEGGAFIMGALALPGLFGKKSDDDKKDPPAGGATPVLVGLAVGCAILGVQACKPSQSPRETGRAVVLVVADAVKQLDIACARVATAKHDAAVATKCADGYDLARHALLGAEAAIDNYDGSGADELPCAVARAMVAAKAMTDAVQAAGGRIPAVVEDALRLAPLLTVACNG
jgi:hypothetical protein